MVAHYATEKINVPSKVQNLSYENKELWIAIRRLILSAVSILDKHYGVGKYSGENTSSENS